LSKCLKFWKRIQGLPRDPRAFRKNSFVERKIVRVFKSLGKKFKGSRRHLGKIYFGEEKFGSV